MFRVEMDTGLATQLVVGMVDVAILEALEKQLK
jgi:hypothetical protein